MPDNDSPQPRRAFAPPRPIPITPAQVAAIAAAHGVPNGPLEPIESIGIINSVYLLGERFVLRVRRDHPGHVAQARREAIATPAAVDAGVSTPRLVGYDDSQQILPVPFLIVDRVNGTNAESLDAVPPEPRAAWRHLGADLGRLHRSPAPPPPGEPWPDEPETFGSWSSFVPPTAGSRRSRLAASMPGLTAWLPSSAPPRWCSSTATSRCRTCSSIGQAAPTGR